MKRIAILFLIAITVFGVFSFGDIVSYVQFHKMSDGGYIDTPTAVSRYGNLFETVYMQKLANEQGKSFVSSEYFEDYLNLLKTHSSYFKVPTWVRYSVCLFEYMKSEGVPIESKFPKAIYEFLNENLKNYVDSPSYYQMIADGLSLGKFLGENLKNSTIYKDAINVIEKSVGGKLYANAGLIVISAFGKNGIRLPKGVKIADVKKFIANNMSYLNGNYDEELTLLKMGLIDAKIVKDTLKSKNVETPSQLFFYNELRKKFGQMADLKKFKTFEKEKAPFGGFYDIGEVSSVRDTYWASKLLNILGMKADKNYWEDFVSNLVSAASAYPVNVLAQYMNYAMDMNVEYGVMSKEQFNSLSKVFAEKMNLSPSLEAYYLATFNFEKAFQVLKVIQETNYKGEKTFLDIHIVLDRLFKGLNKIDKSKRDMAYYYDYVQLLNFAYDFGYDVDMQKVRDVANMFYEFINKNPVDLNLLNALFELEKNYGLEINGDFYLSNLEKLKDQKSGGYLYNTTDGLETFQSTYLALSLLKNLKNLK